MFSWMLEATVCLGYLDLCQGYPWTVGTNRGGCKRVWHNRGSASAAAQLAPSATRHRRSGHRSNGLPRQSGIVAAASSTRPCGHRGRQAACGHGMKRQSGRHVAAAGQKKEPEILLTHDRERGIVDRDRGAKRKGRKGVGKTQNPANDAGDADAGDGKTRNWSPLQYIRLGRRWTLWMRQCVSFAGVRRVAGVSDGQGGLLVAMPPPPWLAWWRSASWVRHRRTTAAPRRPTATTTGAPTYRAAVRARVATMASGTMAA